MSFIFGGNTGLTYEQMIEKRKLAEQLRGALSDAPQNIGEGLTALGQAWAGRMAGKKANEAETAGREQAGSVFASILGGQGGYQAQPPGGGFTGAGMSTQPDVQDQGNASQPSYSIDPQFTKLESQYGLPSGYLGRTYQIESGGNPNAKNPNSSAAGGFQFIDSTAKQYGLTDKFNLQASADAAARLGKDNATVLRNALGREPTAGELYLAHQQGSGGASKLLANPSARAVDIVGADAVRLNGGDANMTAGQFAGKWTGKFGAPDGSNVTVSTQGQPEQITQAGGGGVDPALIEALSDPYMSEGQRSVLGKLLEQQIMSGQPMSEMDRLDMQGKQLGIQKQQMELDQMQQPQQAKTLTERKQLAAEAGFTAGSPEYQTYIATGQLPTPGGGTEFGLTPVLGRDANGNVVIMQLGKDGVAVASKLPDGVTPDLSIKSAEAARGTAIGEAAGDATVKYGAQAGLVDALSGQIDDILSDPYLPKMLGPINSRSPNVTADAARVQAKLDQLSGGAFLQARQLLKGGGAITDYEGQRAEAAFVRMSQAQRPEDFATALREFQYFTQQGMQKLAEQTQLSPTSQVGTPAPAVGAPAQGAATKRFNPATGKIEAIQ